MNEHGGALEQVGRARDGRVQHEAHVVEPVRLVEPVVPVMVRPAAAARRVADRVAAGIAVPLAAAAATREHLVVRAEVAEHDLAEQNMTTPSEHGHIISRSFVGPRTTATMPWMP